jgi:hypothetical protein
VPSRAPEQRRGRKRPNGSFTIHGYHDPQADEEGLHTGSLTTGDLGGNVRATAPEALAGAPAYVPSFPSPSDQAATETSSVAPVVDPRFPVRGTNPPDAVAAAQSAVNPNGNDELTETVRQAAASTADAARSAQEALGALRELAASSHQQAEAYQELKREVDDLRSQLANRA